MKTSTELVELQPYQVIIDKDEYIELLQIKNAYFEGERKTAIERYEHKGNHQLSTEDKELIIKLRKQGLSLRKIANKVGCSAATVGGYLKKRSLNQHKEN